MADLIDVLNGLKTLILQTAYPPSGTPPGNNLSTTLGNCAVMAIAGHPGAIDLDAVAASVGTGTPRVIISVEQSTGMLRNTTRYPRRWKQAVAGTTTLTVTVDATGTMATIGGTAPGSTTQNVALILRYGGSVNRAFVYTTQPSDTLDTIASALAALVDAVTPASAVGNVITIPAAFGLVGRVGGVSTDIKPVIQQIERIQLNVWAPILAANVPQLRDLVAGPIKAVIGNTPWLTMPDTTGARLILCADALLDDPEKAGLYRRCLMLDVEYSTTLSMPAPQVVAPSAALQPGAQPISDFTETDPPTVNVEA